MTLLLAGIAIVLFVAIVATAVVQNRNDEVLGRAPVGPLPVTTPAARITSPTGFPAQGSISIAPTPTAAPTFADVLAEREARAAAARTGSASTFLPGNLGVGTTLTYRGAGSEIIGVLSFDYDGELWQDYVVENPGGTWWRFGVEPDRGYRLAAFDPHPLPIPPGGPTLVYEGSTYHVTDSGRANYRSAGRTQAFERGTYHYYDYENEQGTILSYERFDGGEWQTSIGHRVNPALVTVTNQLPDFDLLG